MLHQQQAKPRKRAPATEAVASAVRARFPRVHAYACVVAARAGLEPEEVIELLATGRTLAELEALCPVPPAPATPRPVKLVSWTCDGCGARIETRRLPPRPHPPRPRLGGSCGCGRAASIAAQTAEARSAAARRREAKRTAAQVARGRVFAARFAGKRNRAKAA